MTEEEQIEQLEKNIDNLIKEQEEREKYIHKLEERLRHLFKSSIISSYDEVHKGKYIKDINMFDKEYISKDKIKKLLETYDKNITWANADDHYYFVKFINEILDE